MEELEPGKVYAGGCLKEVRPELAAFAIGEKSLRTRTSAQPPLTHHPYPFRDSLCSSQLVAKTPCLNIKPLDDGPKNELQADVGGGGILNSNVLYIGDSLFADLVDAKREYGWKTAGVLAELEGELQGLSKPDTQATRKTIEILLSTLRLTQELMGSPRTEDDLKLLDSLEQEVSSSRDRLNVCAGNSKFGSIFRARHQPSLFAQSLRRYCDLYCSSVVDFLGYSFDHRFYPGNSGLGHEQDSSETDSLVLFGFEDDLDEWEDEDIQII